MTGVLPDPENARIAIIGLGYVGLPLAVEFGKKYQTVGYDIRAERVAELREGQDSTRECSAEELAAPRRLSFTTALEDIRDCNVYVVTVPTPIDGNKRPDLSPLMRASEAVGSVLKRGDVVVYESTVYPGCTEEDCAPILEKISGLQFNQDFFCGYSPERINPGDRERRLPAIKKVTSGSTAETADFVDRLYASIIPAGTHKASTIKVAEASKVIENTQRDVNIALINEFALIFHRLGIDTQEVLEAAATKWNFLPFKPGLVGGHCIGVDPYYLIQKAQSVGYYPDVLIAARRINDEMGRHVAGEVIKLMVGKGQAIRGARILVLGFTFKEDCPDLRNTRVIDLIDELQSYGAAVDVYDPLANIGEALHEYGVRLMTAEPMAGNYDAVVIAVGHQIFRQMGDEGIRRFANFGAVIYDIKGVIAKESADGRL